MTTSIPPAQPEDSTIDITPNGMQTPEGIRRVNKALAEQADAARNLASAASLFIERHEIALIEMVSTEDKQCTHDWKQLWALRAAYRQRQEEFVRAVAGAPPSEPARRADRIEGNRENSNCNGSGPHIWGEVRVMPTGGGGNDILCRSCWERALRDRRERNRSILHPVAFPFDLPTWESAKVYDPGE